ncbi:response regulator transcription factor [Saccharopolyspora sp. NPDC000995]
MGGIGPDHGVITVVLVDDHGVVRIGLVELLNAEYDLKVIGQASTVREALTWEEYKPSLRRIAPFSPFGAFSYSATIASLDSGLNTRRDGRAAGSGCAAGLAGPVG